MRKAPSFLRLLFENLKEKGPIALFMTRGLSAARYIEYSVSLRFLEEAVGEALDVGSGHSLFPSLLASWGFRAVSVDAGEAAVRAQAQQGKYPAKQAVMASGTALPFKNEAFRAVTCISVLEHTGSGDTRVMDEIHRVLHRDGTCIISVPISKNDGFTVDPFFGIPTLWRAILGRRAVATLLRWLGVDRTATYYERFYSQELLFGSLIDSTKWNVEDTYVFYGFRPVLWVYHIMPEAVITPWEILMAYLSPQGRNLAWPGRRAGIIVKLRKVAMPKGP